MTTTVVPAAATARRFEDSFERAVLQSERLRVTLVIAGMVAIFARWLFLWVFFPEWIRSQLGGAVNLAALGVIGLAALAYEIAVLIRLTVILRRHGHIPRVVRYVSAFIEVSIPTVAILVGPEVTSPAFAVHTPPAW